MLRGCEQADGQLAIDVDMDLPDLAATAEFILAWSKGAATQRFPAAVDRRADGPARLRGVIPAGADGGRRRASVRLPAMPPPLTTPPSGTSMCGRPASSACRVLPRRLTE